MLDVRKNRTPQVKWIVTFLLVFLAAEGALPVLGVPDKAVQSSNEIGSSTNADLDAVKSSITKGSGEGEKSTGDGMQSAAIANGKGESVPAERREQGGKYDTKLVREIENDKSSSFNSFAANKGAIKAAQTQVGSAEGKYDVALVHDIEKNDDGNLWSERQYSYQTGYEHVGDFMFYAMLAILVTFSNPIRAAFTRQGCKVNNMAVLGEDERSRLLEFRQVVEMRILLSSIASYTEVLVDITHNGKTISLIPYTNGTQSKSGFIALLIEQFGDMTSSMTGFPQLPLLVAVNCHQFDDSDPRSMGYRRFSTVEDWLKNTAKKNVARPLELAYLVTNPNMDLRWCPIRKCGMDDESFDNCELSFELKRTTNCEAALTPSTAGHLLEHAASTYEIHHLSDSNELPPVSSVRKAELSQAVKNVLKRQDGHHEDIGQHLQSIIDQSADDARLSELGSGRRVFDLQTRPIDINSMIFAAVCATSLTWFIYAASKGALSRYVAERPDIHLSYNEGDVKPLGNSYLRYMALAENFVWNPPNSYSLTRVWVEYYIIYEQYIMILLWAAFCAFLDAWVPQLGKGVADRVGYRNLLLDDGLDRLMWLCLRHVTVMGGAAFATLRLFTLSKSLTWYNNINVKVIETGMAYFLFAINSAIKYLQAYLTSKNITLQPILSDVEADIVLTFITMTEGTNAVISLNRPNHGWEDACHFAELGYTFRRIIEETPSMFPKNSEQELFCTESVLTFDQVLHATAETTWDDKEDSVLHTGNVCNLECSVTHSNGEKETTSYPIQCAIEGLAKARWTLSAERDRQRYRLCPTPR